MAHDLITFIGGKLIFGNRVLDYVAFSLVVQAILTFLDLCRIHPERLNIGAMNSESTVCIRLFVQPRVAFHKLMIYSLIWTQIPLILKRTHKFQHPFNQRKTPPACPAYIVWYAVTAGRHTLPTLWGLNAIGVRDKAYKFSPWPHDSFPKAWTG